MQLTAQQARDEAVLKGRKRREQARSARAQVEYREHLKRLALARFRKREKKLLLGESTPEEAAATPPQLPPENTPRQSWDPNNPGDGQPSDDQGKMVPSPPLPGEQ